MERKRLRKSRSPQPRTSSQFEGGGAGRLSPSFSAADRLRVSHLGRSHSQVECGGLLNHYSGLSRCRGFESRPPRTSRARQCRYLNRWMALAATLRSSPGPPDFTKAKARAPLICRGVAKHIAGRWRSAKAGIRVNRRSSYSASNRRSMVSDGPAPASESVGASPGLSLGAGRPRQSGDGRRDSLAVARQ